MQATIIRIWEHADGTFGVSVAVQETSPGRRIPRTLRRPWEHTFTLGPDFRADHVFAAVRDAIKAISTQHDWG